MLWYCHRSLPTDWVIEHTWCNSVVYVDKILAERCIIIVWQSIGIIAQQRLHLTLNLMIGTLRICKRIQKKLPFISASQWHYIIQYEYLIPACFSRYTRCPTYTSLLIVYTEFFYILHFQKRSLYLLNITTIRLGDGSGYCIIPWLIDTSQHDVRHHIWC